MQTCLNLIKRSACKITYALEISSNMASPVCFITFVISYVSLGVGVGFCFNSGCQFGYASHGIAARSGSRSSPMYWLVELVQAQRHFKMFQMARQTRETESLLLWNLVYLDLSLSGVVEAIPPQSVVCHRSSLAIFEQCKACLRYSVSSSLLLGNLKSKLYLVN
ncbi:hypothetical protein V6N11_070657 [Hibiscus sabdariffa]|uniref:Uncharacterized protein n=1 Tax=Hibiscus sabdariffa TaxID=183260 RepID=A0ABR2QG34_9ROSI